jgi:multidrug efflux pump subunit AcrA (membrane-fusion protein)
MSKRENRPWYLYVLAVVAVTIAVLAVSEIGPPTSSARTSTQIVTAEDGVVQSSVTGTGNVAAGSDLDVNFQTSGTLSKVDVKVGQHVSRASCSPPSTPPPPGSRSTRPRRRRPRPRTR